MVIAVCDDISLHRNALRPLIESYFTAKALPFALHEFDSGELLLASNHRFDIAFLDIEMGDLNGIEAATQLKKKNPNCIIIIVTSYTRYLDAAMDIHAIRFLQKPIAPERVHAALDKALSELNDKQILLSAKNNQILRVSSRDVIFAEANLKNVILYTAHGTYTIKESLKKLRSLLCGDAFAVPHNSFIVNMNFISDFSRTEITLRTPQGKKQIPVSGRMQPAFKRRFFEFIKEGE